MAIYGHKLEMAEVRTELDVAQQKYLMAE